MLAGAQFFSQDVFAVPRDSDQAVSFLAISGE